MKHMYKLAMAALLASTFSLPALADDDLKEPNASRAPLSTQDFVKMATVGNNFEIASSRLALQRSHSAKIKNFAQHMINDHSMVGKNIKPVIAASNLEAAMPKNKLDETHRAEYNMLKNTSAANFDMKYLAAQESAHKEAISLFRDYSINGGDDNLKKFAADALPTLENHQKELMNLHSPK